MSAIHDKRPFLILSGLFLMVAGILIISHIRQPRRIPLILAGHSDEVTALAFSPDGQLLATAGDNQRADLYRGETQVWDRQTLRRQQTLIFPSGVGDNNQVIFSPDSSRIVGSNDRNITVWNAHTGHLIKNVPMDKNFPKSSFFCFALFFDNDGALRDCEVDGDNSQIVKVWDRFSSRQIWRFFNGTEVQAIVISPNHRILAVASFDAAWHQQVKLLDVSTGQLLRVVAPPLPHNTSPQMQAKSVCFSPDSKRIALASSESILVLDAHTGRALQTLPFAVRGLEYPNALAFSPDGTHLAVGTNGQDATWLEGLAENSHHFGTLNLWNLQTGEIKTLSGYDGGVDFLIYAPDGRILWCNNTMAWDIRDLK